MAELTQIRDSLLETKNASEAESDARLVQFSAAVASYEDSFGDQKKRFAEMTGVGKCKEFIIVPPKNEVSLAKNDLSNSGSVRTNTERFSFENVVYDAENDCLDEVRSIIKLF